MIKDVIIHDNVLRKKPHQVVTNTEQAARDVLRTNQDWLEKLKSRLVDTSDLTNASGALGEIRAYGSLLGTAMTVKTNPTVPRKNVVPEFDVDAGDGAVIVEVHSRQLDPAQAEAVAKNLKQHRAEHKFAVEEAAQKGENDGVFTSSTIGVIPLGAPVPGKVGDSVLTNATGHQRFLVVPTQKECPHWRRNVPMTKGTEGRSSNTCPPRFTAAILSIDLSVAEIMSGSSGRRYNPEISPPCIRGSVT
jgi:hypothetical protein